MKGTHSKQEQSHPLYSTDRDLVDKLLAKKVPADGDLVDLARLLLRYEGFPGSLDIQSDMMKILSLWGLTREKLNLKTRKIWNEGYRPGSDVEESVGSGFDTEDNETV